MLEQLLHYGVLVGPLHAGANAVYKWSATIVFTLFFVKSIYTLIALLQILDFDVCLVLQEGVEGAPD